MRFMQTESVLQTKNRSGPAKNRFSVALHLVLDPSAMHSNTQPTHLYPIYLLLRISQILTNNS